MPLHVGRGILEILPERASLQTKFFTPFLFASMPALMIQKNSF